MLKHTIYSPGVLFSTYIIRWAYPTVYDQFKYGNSYKLLDYKLYFEQVRDTCYLSPSYGKNMDLKKAQNQDFYILNIFALLKHKCV